MQIHYVQGPTRKLFSFHRHDYNSDGDIFIDGGFDYIRTNGTVEYAEIHEVIKEIRQQFTWISVLDKDGNFLEKHIKRLLSNLDTDHILRIILHLNDNLKSTSDITYFKYLIAIFTNELIYRQNNIEDGIL